MEEDGFQLVTHNKRKGKQRNSKVTKPSENQTTPEPIADVHAFKRRYDDVVAEILTSDYFLKLKKAFEKLAGEALFDQAICLGVGNFSESVPARFQLGLFDSLVKSAIQKYSDFSVTVFEPKFTETEISFIKEFLGFDKTSGSATDNLEGRHRVSSKQKTLVFMPHCSKQLTNNLLEENWDSNKLQNLVLFCNSFDKLCLSQPERILKQQRAGLVIKAAAVCTETPVENCFRLSDVFNDLNLHSFHSDRLADQNENFWTVDPALAIQEDDLEFVPRTTVETY